MAGKGAWAKLGMSQAEGNRLASNDILRAASQSYNRVIADGGSHEGGQMAARATARGMGMNPDTGHAHEGRDKAMGKAAHAKLKEKKAATLTEPRPVATHSDVSNAPTFPKPAQLKALRVIASPFIQWNGDSHVNSAGKRVDDTTLKSLVDAGWVARRPSPEKLANPGRNFPDRGIFHGLTPEGQRALAASPLDTSKAEARHLETRARRADRKVAEEEKAIAEWAAYGKGDGLFAKAAEERMAGHKARAEGFRAMAADVAGKAGPGKPSVTIKQKLTPESSATLKGMGYVAESRGGDPKFSTTGRKAGRGPMQYTKHVAIVGRADGQPMSADDERAVRTVLSGE